MGRTFEEIDFAIKNKEFTPPKPIEFPNTAALERITALDAAGRLMMMKKDDGHGHINVVGYKPTDINLYSLLLNNATERHRHIVQDLHAISFPEKTILCGEIARMVNGVQNRYQVRISKENEAEHQAKGRYSVMSIFNNLMWNGEDTTQWSNYDRYMQIVEHIKQKNKSFDYVRATELVSGTLAEARIRAKELKWEAMVLYDPDATTEIIIGAGDTIPRPFGCWKDKDHYELDFVAYAYEPSTAKSHPGAVRDFYIGLYEPKTGHVIPICKCGGGMKKQDRITYSNPDMLPVAIEVKFEKWSDNGALLQGHILRIRDAATDKKWKQCTVTPELLETTTLSKITKRIDPRTVERIIPRGKKPQYIN